jgi:hypothetical protein
VVGFAMQSLYFSRTVVNEPVAPGSPTVRVRWPSDVLLEGGAEVSWRCVPVEDADPVLEDEVSVGAELDVVAEPLSREEVPDDVIVVPAPVPVTVVDTDGVVVDAEPE